MSDNVFKSSPKGDLKKWLRQFQKPVPVSGVKLGYEVEHEYAIVDLDRLAETLMAKGFRARI